MKDPDTNGIQIAFKIYPDGMTYYKLRNTYTYPVKVQCHFKFTDRAGKAQAENGCVATLAPGQEKTDGGWWDANVATIDSSSLSAEVHPANTPQSSRSSSSLIISTCDLGPSEIEKGCEQKRASCDNNTASWCEVKFGKLGTQRNTENHNQFNSCVTAGKAGCTTSLSQCISHIRRCGDGQTCDIHTFTCRALDEKNSR